MQCVDVCPKQNIHLGSGKKLKGNEIVIILLKIVLFTEKIQQIDRQIDQTKDKSKRKEIIKKEYKALMKIVQTTFNETVDYSGTHSGKINLPGNQ